MRVTQHEHALAAVVARGAASARRPRLSEPSRLASSRARARANVRERARTGARGARRGAGRRSSALASVRESCGRSMRAFRLDTPAASEQLCLPNFAPEDKPILPRHLIGWVKMGLSSGAKFGKQSCSDGAGVSRRNVREGGAQLRLGSGWAVVGSDFAPAGLQVECHSKCGALSGGSNREIGWPRGLGEQSWRREAMAARKLAQRGRLGGQGSAGGAWAPRGGTRATRETREVRATRGAQW